VGERRRRRRRRAARRIGGAEGGDSGGAEATPARSRDYEYDGSDVGSSGRECGGRVTRELRWRDGSFQSDRRGFFSTIRRTRLGGPGHRRTVYLWC
jgi:hypothetical protein